MTGAQAWRHRTLVSVMRLSEMTLALNLDNGEGICLPADAFSAPPQAGERVSYLPLAGGEDWQLERLVVGEQEIRWWEMSD